MALERIVPGTVEWEAYYANHICRYTFAKNTLPTDQPLTILDAACGVGYGSHFLAENGPWQIFAIDQSNVALETAARYFSKSNVQFLKDDCHTLKHTVPFAPFDAIISFETLEHLEYPEKFLEHCFAVLKTGGTLILSTPNKLVSSPTGEMHSKFHEREYTSVELHELLTHFNFREVTLFGQQYTEAGKERRQRRNEFYNQKRNFFSRVRRKIQSMIRFKKPRLYMPEQIEDFEIISYDHPHLPLKEESSGPFVLLAVCKK